MLVARIAEQVIALPVCRYFSTLPSTFENEMRVNLGLGIPNAATIADRAYNTRQMTNAYLGWEAVASVGYDPR